MKRNTHVEALTALKEEQKYMRKKIFKRDRKVVETLGTLVYDLTKTANPDSAYEDQVSLFTIMGVDV